MKYNIITALTEPHAFKVILIRPDTKKHYTGTFGLAVSNFVKDVT